jgi:methylene-fatty-acyl-phospholipid synthase
MPEALDPSHSCFNPLYWNIVAQNEYRNRTITKVLQGNRYLGCYLLGASIFLLGLLRDHL